jgi:hypothetical protein
MLCLLAREYSSSGSVVGALGAILSTGDFFWLGDLSLQSFHCLDLRIIVL